MDRKYCSLGITQIELKNFRCFDHITLEINQPITLIEGLNGAGKTTLLEALHYACYLRSFRTYTPREMIRFGGSDFFVRLQLAALVDEVSFEHEVQVGFSHNKRLVKVDKRPVTSYKELLNYYRVVSLTEDDLELIKGSPQVRRSFIDQAIILDDPDFALLSREFKYIVDSRNALLHNPNLNIMSDSFKIWTQQLWIKSRAIQAVRKEMLSCFTREINRLIADYFNDSFSLILIYEPKKEEALNTFDDFWAQNHDTFIAEQRFGRTLFGAHLDDFSIHLQDKKSRQFASRGQQKLIVLMFKVAQIRLLGVKKGPIVFLLDDFMTDFDHERAQVLLSMVQGLNSQLIFTAPGKTGFLQEQLATMGAQSIILPN